MSFEPEHFVGGALCLDFANTVGGHRDGVWNETLHTYGDLLDWAVAGGAMSKGAALRLRDVARAGESRAARILIAAKELREAIYEIFLARADERQPPAAAIAKLNAHMGEAYPNLQLKAHAGAFELAWPASPTDLRAPLWPVTKSAVDLLLNDHAHLRACASETCNWLFVDESKNHSRRWCSMRDCGNRAKVRRFRTVG